VKPNFVPSKLSTFSSVAGCTPCVPLFMYPQHINFFACGGPVPCPFLAQNPSPYPVPCPFLAQNRLRTLSPVPFQNPSVPLLSVPLKYTFSVPLAQNRLRTLSPVRFLAEFGPYPYLLVPLTVLDLQKISLRTPP